MSCGGELLQGEIFVKFLRNLRVFFGAQLIEYSGASITLGNRYLRNLKLSKIRAIQ